MNKSNAIKISILITGFFAFTTLSNAQETNKESAINTKITRVLKEKKRLLKNGNIKNYYTIQVFSGNIEGAQKVLAKCKVEFEDKSQIIYETPNYKVHIGAYRNQLDADRALIEITASYEYAFTFKPKESNKP